MKNYEKQKKQKKTIKKQKKTIKNRFKTACFFYSKKNVFFITLSRAHFSNSFERKEVLYNGQ